MDAAARRYARWVLIIHLAVLAAVIGIVVVASRDIYATTRTRVLADASRQQELLAVQTSRAIKTHYESILDTLDLLRQNDDEPAATQPTDSSASPTSRPTRLLDRLLGGSGHNGQGGGPNAVAEGGPPEPPPRQQGGPPPDEQGDPSGRPEPGSRNPPGAPRSEPGGAGRLTQRAADRMFDPARGGSTRLTWAQLEGRVTNVFVFERQTRRLTRWTGPTIKTSRDAIVQSIGPAIDAVKEAQISGVCDFDGQRVNLACVPLPGPNSPVLVAPIPLRSVEAKFLVELDRRENLVAQLVDDTGTVLTGSDKGLPVGANPARDFTDPRMRDFAAKVLNEREGQTITFDTERKVGAQILPPAMTTLWPVELRDKRWTLAVSSKLEGVETNVAGLFTSARRLAIFTSLAVSAVLISTAVQMIRARMRLERVRHESLARELDQARQIQLAWLPRKGSEPLGLTINAVNRPANHISGDFYNWFLLPDGRTCVVIGDVTGHGMSAAFLMATTQLIVRNLMPVYCDPGKCLEEVNRQLRTQVFNGQFVTMQILVLDSTGPSIEIATAGHPVPFISDGTSFRELELEPQYILGITEEATYPTERFAVGPGCAILLYTDGLTDVINATGKRFTTAGLRKVLGAGATQSAAVLDTILAEIDAFRGTTELADDLTLVTVQMAGFAVPALAINP